MIIDIHKVVRETLREGETIKSVSTQLNNLAMAHMIRDFDGLKQRLPLLPQSTTRKQFIEFLNAKSLSAETVQRFREIMYDHKIGYLGEMSVHSALAHDWRDVFKYNKLGVYNTPDGEVHERSERSTQIKLLTFDVKSHHKDLCGLSVPADRVRCDLYVACHWLRSKMHVLGYATKADVLSARKNQYNKLCIAPSALRPFSDFLHRFH